MSSLEFHKHNLEDLTQHFIHMGEKPFRAKQLCKWVYGRGETSLDKMTDLSKDFRQKMKTQITFNVPSVIQRLESTDGTVKFLFSVGAGETIESVLIPSGNRLTLCVSSEVGCNLGCKFCFTGKKKMRRRLQVHEIVGQYTVAAQSLSQDQKITNIVFMGMGEPLDNPDAVFKSIEILNSSWGVNLSRKKITVSTAGVVPMIPRVTHSGVRLAVSLNAVDNETRSRIMPINKKWPLEQLLEACRQHSQATKDLVTLEYVLLKDVNDSIESAKKLCSLVKDVPSKINIIPFNEHPDSGFSRPSNPHVDRFQKYLMNQGVHVLRRKTMGRDILANAFLILTACHLRISQMEARLTHEPCGVPTPCGRPPRILSNRPRISNSKVQPYSQHLLQMKQRL